ncbi:MAG: ExbD/TolR family protein [Phycisphaerales bacterium]
MQRVRRQTEGYSLDLAPLIDVVFLLLTFFVFSLALAVQVRITEIRLPEGSPGGEPSQGITAVVALDAGGAITLDGEPVALEELGAALIRAREASPDMIVYVATDERASAGDMFRLMDAFAGASITDLRFLRSPPSPTEPPQFPASPGSSGSPGSGSGAAGGPGGSGDSPGTPAPEG